MINTHKQIHNVKHNNKKKLCVKKSNVYSNILYTHRCYKQTSTLESYILNLIYTNFFVMRVCKVSLVCLVYVHS